MTKMIALAGILFAVPAFAGPFGFDQGQTKAQIEAKVGKLDATKCWRSPRTAEF